MNNVSMNNRYPTLPPHTDSEGSLTAIEKSILGNFIALVKPKIILEIGMYKGATTRFICKFIEQNDIDSIVIGFDFPEVIKSIKERNKSIQEYEKKSLLQMIPGTSPGSVNKWLIESKKLVDITLIDAEHEYGSVIKELNLLWPRLSEAGYILCHDYSAKFDGVRYATDYFAKRHKAMILSLSSLDRQKESDTKNYMEHPEGGSVIVALCRRPYKYSKFNHMMHAWKSTRRDLLTIPFIRKSWVYLKPFVKFKKTNNESS